jgi:hypothetical protein
MFCEEGQALVKQVKQSTQPIASLGLASSIQTDQQNSQDKNISKKHLINSLNRINFADGEISLLFRHTKYHSIISLQAQPQVCSNGYLQCLWTKPVKNPNKMKHYTFDGFTFTDGYKQIQVPAGLIELNEKGVDLELPQLSSETYRREVKRHDCKEISAQISQEGWHATGALVNFTAQSIAVNFHHEFSLLKNEIDPKHHVHLVLKMDREFIFSGSCRILRQKNSSDKKILILKPLTESVHRIKSKEFRSERLILNPLPNIIFQHPIIQKKINLGLIDISGLGFSVEEDKDNAVLLPGMVIPELEIQFMHGFSIRCKSQVLYRIDQGDVVKCGIVILDMNMRDHLKLSSFIHQAKNRNSYISTTNIDIEALWNFFFDSGFIYPDKYKHIAKQKDKFISVYNKLYTQNPEIARHVIYQNRGKIYGHVSMFRFYQSTWMMNHHAAVKSTKHKAGLVVMDHILQYINELHSLPSAKMNYIGCYFRPNNRFANRVFGAASKALNDLKKSSLDEFAYYHFQTGNPVEKPTSSWVLCESNSEDIEIMNHWYNKVYGGLLPSALDLAPDTFYKDEAISNEYLATGFKRDRKIFSLRKNDELMAIFVINISDFGLNMSDLTNCIQIFAMDQKLLSKKIINYALTQLAEYHENDFVPVLLYPKSYADDQNLSYSKTYTLCILNLDYISEYRQFIDSLTSHKKPIKIKQIK